MTMHDTARKASNQPMAAIRNLADLAAWLGARPDLPTRQRQDLLSAFGTLARAARKPLEALPADPGPLRTVLNGLTPVMAGVSDRRWCNVRSLLRRAFALAGASRPAGGRKEPRSGAWLALLGSLPDFRARHRLARLSGHCSRIGIPPAEVDDAVLQRFLEGLQADPLVKEPLRIHRDAIVEWNRHAGTRPGWPARALAVPDRSRGYALPQDAIPASLTAELDAWRRRLAGEDLLGERDFRPLRPASLATRERQVRTLIAAMAQGGVDPATLRGLADLVVPETVACGLTVLMQRTGGTPTVHAGQVAGLACAIARHQVGVPPEQLARLDRIRRRATPPAAGLTPRNRERLRPFDDPGQVRAFLALPRKVREEVRRAGLPAQGPARLLRNAVAMEVLIMAPIRLGNLLSLRLGTNLLRGPGGCLTIALEPHETKNRQVFEATLPAESSRMIEAYLARYQPLLCQSRCGWLFPDAAGEGPMGEDGLRQALEDLVRNRCGLIVNPHLYRHIAAKLILDQQPGAYGQARLTLGHKSVATTTGFYAGMETRRAVQRYDEIVLQARGAALPAAPRPRAGGRR